MNPLQRFLTALHLVSARTEVRPLDGRSASCSVLTPVPADPPHRPEPSLGLCDELDEGRLLSGRGRNDLA
jgi:hypothetical protein